MNLIPSINASQTVRRPSFFRPTPSAREDASYLRKDQHTEGSENFRNFSITKAPPSIKDAIAEAQRCLKCTNAPCVLSCPAQLNVNGAHNALSEGEFYLAAQYLLTPNPLAWTCGYLCPTDQTCRGSCVLSNSEIGSIRIPQLHRIILEVFYRSGLPSLPPLQGNNLRLLFFHLLAPLVSMTLYSIFLLHLLVQDPQVSLVQHFLHD